MSKRDQVFIEEVASKDELSLRVVSEELSGSRKENTVPCGNKGNPRAQNISKRSPNHLRAMLKQERREKSLFQNSVY